MALSSTRNYKQSRGRICAAAVFGQLEIEPCQGEDHKNSALDSMKEHSNKIRVMMEAQNPTLLTKQSLVDHQ